MQKIPSYCRHNPSGQAYVEIGGKQIYLGKYGSEPNGTTGLCISRRRERTGNVILMVLYRRNGYSIDSTCHYM